MVIQARLGWRYTLASTMVDDDWQETGIATSGWASERLLDVRDGLY
jgi:hypothetical protein